MLYLPDVRRVGILCRSMQQQYRAVLKITGQTRVRRRVDPGRELGAQKQQLQRRRGAAARVSSAIETRCDAIHSAQASPSVVMPTLHVEIAAVQSSTLICDV